MLGGGGGGVPVDIGAQFHTYATIYKSNNLSCSPGAGFAELQYLSD